ncbi:MAG: FkbM family methyltransferase [Methylobacter sp.]|uniref:FkbM family methyltransferase n=1 Tax=Methylobacter sp. TaxID=2051955 RepID=UPI00272FCA6D|nr:FkbM family methyltransferase [Methylobacter sp.]MDP1666469.1 FkbM family methyltransferase [Methylobacter sp.]
MKDLFKRFIPKGLLKSIRDIRNNFLGGYCLKSYSQEGEDMILRRMLEKQQFGFYVDVGAHHPFRFSNTYYFYKQGWKGINIDAMPGSMELFRKFRQRDINLEIPISNSDQVLTYYAFNEPALNGFSKDLSQERNGTNGYFIQQEIKMQTSKLSTVLDKHLPIGTEIDFLSIDVEGLDLDILHSIDWNKYKPKIILVEILESGLFEIENSKIALFLEKYSYRVFAKSVNTVFFVQNNFKP